MDKLRDIGGFILLAVGAIGCVFPILPGIPLVLAGVYILAPRYPRIQVWQKHIEQFWTSIRKQAKSSP